MTVVCLFVLALRDEEEEDEGGREEEDLGLEGPEEEVGVEGEEEGEMRGQLASITASSSPPPSSFSFSFPFPESREGFLQDEKVLGTGGEKVRECWG